MLFRYFYFLLLSSILDFGLINAQVLSEHLNSIKYLERISDFQFDIKVSFIENRWSKNYQISEEYLKLAIITELKNKNFNVIEQSFDSKGLLPIKMTVKISYLNFYESSAGNVFGKGILDIELVNPNDTRSILKYTVSSSIPFLNLRINDYQNSIHYSKFLDMGNQVINELVERLLQRLNNFTREVKLAYRSVVSIGTAPIISSTEEAKKVAIINALHNSCARMFGISIENIATLIDFADVNDKTTTTSRGIILDHRVLEEYTTITDDNFICIVVEALLLNNLDFH